MKFFESSGRIPALDVARTISIFWLVAIHTFSYINRTGSFEQRNERSNDPLIHWMALGHYGVDVFFVLSGFLIGKMVFEAAIRGKFSVSQFLLRRSFRILPLYYFSLVICFYFFSQKGSDHIGYNFAFIQNYLPYDDQFMTWTWSLAIEEQFYLTLAFLFFFLKLNPKQWIALAMGGVVFSLALRIYLASIHNLTEYFSWFGSQFYLYFETLYSPTYARMGELIVGILGAMLFVTGAIDRRYSRLVTCTCAVSLAIWAFLPGFETFLSESFGYLWIGSDKIVFSTFVMALLVFNIDTNSAWMKHKGWAFMAQLSYGIFLFHVMLIKVLTDPLVDAGITGVTLHYLALFTTLVGVTLVAAVLFLTLEKPGIELGRKLARMIEQKSGTKP